MHNAENLFEGLKAYPSSVNPKPMKLTGEVRVRVLSEDDCIFNAPLYCLDFAENSRTFWRFCQGGAIYLVLDGTAQVGFKEQGICEHQAGALLRVKPLQEHFIGAGRGGCRILSILTNLPNNTVVYGREVSREELQAAVD